MLFLQKRQTAQNDRKQIVEVVRDAASQLADAFHLLRLVKLLENNFPLARAFGNDALPTRHCFGVSVSRASTRSVISVAVPNHRDNLAVRRPHRDRAQFEPAIGTVGPAKTSIVRRRHRRSPATASRPIPRHVAIRLMNGLKPSPSEMLFHGSAGVGLPLRIEVVAFSIGAGGPDQLGQRPPATRGGGLRFLADAASAAIRSVTSRQIVVTKTRSSAFHRPNDTSKCADLAVLRRPAT